MAPLCGACTLEAEIDWRVDWARHRIWNSLPQGAFPETAYQPFGAGRVFPVAQQLAAEVLSLPMSPFLGESCRRKVLAVVAEFCRTI